MSVPISVAIRATNDVSKAPFSMVKETNRQCGTNMSIHKCGGEAMMRGNHYMDRVVSKEGTEYGWLLNQLEWVQYYIIIYSEERARKEEKRHTTALKKYGEYLLTRFRKDVEEHQRKEWKRYESSVKYHAMIYTKECFRTVDGMKKALSNLIKNKQEP